MDEAAYGFGVLLAGVLGLAQMPIVQNLRLDCVRPVYIVAGDLNADGWDDIAP